MKSRFVRLKALTLSLVLLTAVSGCEDKNATESTSDTASETAITTEATASENSVAESSEIPESSQDSGTVSGNTEKQIVHAVCKEYYGAEDNETAEYIVEKAEAFGDKYIGSISSEKDAIEKAKAVLIDCGVEDYIEEAESDTVEINGEMVKYDRSNSPYTVIFYNEYDAWLVSPNLPSGITEDGRAVATPGMPPYVILQGSDGKVLGIFL